FVHVILLILLSVTEAQAASSEDASMQSTTGYIALQDGVRLHFTTVSPASGKPRSTIVIPNEIYMFDDFRHLGAEHRVIFYDLRNRGRSDLISDPEKLTR